MIDTIRYIEEQRRMCKMYHDNECNGCPLRLQMTNTCMLSTGTSSEAIVAIVDTWSKMNPQKTYLMDLREKFPDLNEYYVIEEICLDTLYKHAMALCDDITDHNCCRECWNQPMEDRR